VLPDVDHREIELVDQPAESVQKTDEHPPNHRNGKVQGEGNEDGPAFHFNAPTTRLNVNSDMRRPDEGVGAKGRLNSVRTEATSSLRDRR
jgi:hypothetical protein